MRLITEMEITFDVLQSCVHLPSIRNFMAKNLTLPVKNPANSSSLSGHFLPMIHESWSSSNWKSLRLFWDPKWRTKRCVIHWSNDMRCPPFSRRGVEPPHAPLPGRRRGGGQGELQIWERHRRGALACRIARGERGPSTYDVRIRTTLYMDGVLSCR